MAADNTIEILIKTLLDSGGIDALKNGNKSAAEAMRELLEQARTGSSEAFAELKKLGGEYEVFATKVETSNQKRDNILSTVPTTKGKAAPKRTSQEEEDAARKAEEKQALQDRAAQAKDEFISAMAAGREASEAKRKAETQASSKRQDTVAARQHGPAEFGMQDAIQASMQRREAEEAQRVRAQNEAALAGKRISAEHASNLSKLAIVNEQIEVNKKQQELAKQRRTSQPTSQQAPAPTPTQEDASEGSSYAVRRHFGAVAGQVLGMPGLGMMAAVGGMAAGIGVVVLALEKVIGLFKEWNAKIEAVVDNQRAFDMVGERIDSLANKQRQLARENQTFALSYAQIERQVHTVSAAITHLTSQQEIAITFEKRLADAQLQATLARIALDNRFSPIQRIAAEQAAKEAAFIADQDRERRSNEEKIALKKLEADMAEERKKRFTDEAALIDKEIPALARKAQEDKEKEKTFLEGGELKRKEIDSEMKIVERLKSGHGTAGDMIKYYANRALANQELNPATAASDRLRALNIEKTPEQFASIAQERYNELVKERQGVADDDNRARMVAGDSEQKLEIARQRRKNALGEVDSSERERQKSEQDAEYQRRAADLQERYRAPAQGATIEAQRTEATRQTLDALQAPPIGPETTKVFQDMRDTLLDIRAALTVNA